MKINKRDFIKQGSLLAITSMLPKSGDNKTNYGASITKDTLVVHRKTCNVPIGMPMFDKHAKRRHYVSAPFVDLLLSIDHPRQRLACTCEYTLDGQCVQACETGDALLQHVAEKAIDLFSVIHKHVGDDVIDEIYQCWQEYRNAENEYRDHYCTGWVMRDGENEDKSE